MFNPASIVNDNEEKRNAKILGLKNATPINIDGNTFKFHKLLKADFQRWRCVKGYCMASLKLDPNGTVVDCNLVHNHPRKKLRPFKTPNLIDQIYEAARPKHPMAQLPPTPEIPPGATIIPAATQIIPAATPIIQPRDLKTLTSPSLLNEENTLAEKDPLAVDLKPDRMDNDEGNMPGVNLSDCGSEAPVNSDPIMYNYESHPSVNNGFENEPAPRDPPRTVRERCNDDFGRFVASYLAKLPESVEDGVKYSIHEILYSASKTAKM